MSKYRSGAIRFSTLAAVALALSAAPVTAGQMEHKTTAGQLVIEDAFSRETLPNQPVAGAFLTLTNTGDSADRLIGGTSAVAGRVEVHEMAMDGDVMKMRELDGGLEVQPGETVELKPGGYHIMLFDLTDRLKEGDMIEVTLEFAEAGEVTVPVMVHGKSAKSAHAHAAHSH